MKKTWILIIAGLVASCSTLNSSHERSVASNKNEMACKRWNPSGNSFSKSKVDSDIIIINKLESEDLEIKHVLKDLSTSTEQVSKVSCRGSEIGSQSKLRGECYETADLKNRISFQRLFGKLLATYKIKADEAVNILNFETYECKNDFFSSEQ